MELGIAKQYIAFEGVEGAGKSTVAARVAKHLEAIGEQVVLVREPGGTPLGESVRSILLDGEVTPVPLAEAALFASSRAQLIHDVVRPALMSGAWVLSDRTVYSSLAYQAIGRRLGVNRIRIMNDIAIDGLWPGRVVLLRLDALQGLARQSVDDRIGGESEDFHKRVMAGFDELAETEPDRFLIVDATSDIDQVVAETISGLDL